MMDDTQTVRLTSLAHGGGCGCKLDPAVLTDILGAPSGFPVPKDLLVDAATRDAWLQRHGAKISMPKVIDDAEDGVSMVRVAGTAAA